MTWLIPILVTVALLAWITLSDRAHRARMERLYDEHFQGIPNPYRKETP